MYHIKATNYQARPFKWVLVLFSQTVSTVKLVGIILSPRLKLLYHRHTSTKLTTARVGSVCVCVAGEKPAEPDSNRTQATCTWAPRKTSDHECLGSAETTWIVHGQTT